MIQIHRHGEAATLHDRENTFDSEEEAQTYLDALLASMRERINEALLPDSALHHGWSIVDRDAPPAPLAVVEGDADIELAAPPRSAHGVIHRPKPKR